MVNICIFSPFFSFQRPPAKKLRNSGCQKMSRQKPSPENELYKKLTSTDTRCHGRKDKKPLNFKFVMTSPAAVFYLQYNFTITTKYHDLVISGENFIQFG